MMSHWRTKRRTQKARPSQEGSSTYTVGECIKVMESSRPRVAILENVELIGKPQDSWDRVDDPELSAEPSAACVPPGAEHKRLGGLCGRRSARFVASCPVTWQFVCRADAAESSRAARRRRTGQKTPD